MNLATALGGCENLFRCVLRSASDPSPGIQGTMEDVDDRDEEGGEALTVEEEPMVEPKKKHKGKHDKPKPWDTPDIDHWKLERFDPSYNEGGMLEESSFSTLFPQYRGISPSSFGYSLYML